MIDDDEDDACDVEQRGESPVLLSIPTLDAIGDRLFSASHVEFDAPPAATASIAASATVVPLSIPEANVLQNFVQGTRQRVIALAGGSVFWRLFVGSGVAILMGAVTLILLGPSEDRLQDDETAAVAASPRPIAGPLANQPGDSHAKIANARIELTVNESPHAGPVPAEYDDPFTEANLVTAKVNPAIHLIDSSSESNRNVIQPVSRTQTVQAQPAWLSGTIDIDDDPQPAPLKRNYERSRPSNR
jgi:hypothetical protein